METQKTQIPPSVAVSYTGIGINGDGVMGKANIDTAYVKDAFNELLQPTKSELEEKQIQINQLKNDLEENDKIIERLEAELVSFKAKLENHNTRIMNLSAAFDYSITEVYKTIFDLPYYRIRTRIRNMKSYFANIIKKFSKKK